MPLRALLVLLTVSLAAPVIAQIDPPPSTAEVAPGVVLHVDWEPLVLAEREVVDADGDGVPERVDGCEGWQGEFFPDPEAEDDLVLREAWVEVDGHRVALDTWCVGAYEWSLPSTEADAFEVSRPLDGLVELTIPFDWDASGTSRTTWTVGPDGARRRQSWRDGERGLGTEVRAALADDRAVRERLAQELAATVAAERAAAEARALVERRRETLRQSAERARAVVDRVGPTLDSLGVAVPEAPPAPGAPLRLAACAVAPEAGGGRIEPGAGAVLAARVESAEAAVAWVDLGDGASDLVIVADGRLRVPHVYAHPGTYRATVTAVDPGSAETCAVEVQVGGGGDPFCADVYELNSVFFGPGGDAGLGAESAMRIDENADLLGRCPSLCVVVAGYADETDPERASGERAEAVRQAYAERGFAPSRFRAEGRGEGPTCRPIGDPGPGDARCRVVESLVVPCAEVR